MLGIAGIPAIYDLEIFLLFPTQFMQCAPKNGDSPLCCWIHLWVNHQHGDLSNASRLLCARRNRPRYRAAKGDNEFSPPDVDGHVTLSQGGRVHAIEGTISRFSERRTMVLRCESLSRLWQMRHPFTED